MSERDESIGRNLQLLRRERSQQWLADEMRARGHKWSQSTVWSVEKGDRPVRLAEAEDLARILKLSNPLRLLADHQELSLTQASDGYEVAIVMAIRHVDEAEEMRTQLRALVSDPDFDPGRVSPKMASRLKEMAETPAVEVVRKFVAERAARAGQGD